MPDGEVSSRSSVQAASPRYGAALLTLAPYVPARVAPINFNVELLRLIAAFGIVVFHAGDVPGRLAAYSGLVIFVIFFLYFMPNPKKQPPYTILKNRASRLILPWLFWSILYGTINILSKNIPCNYTSTIPGEILTGTSIHLWFLPFAFLISIPCIYLDSNFKRSKHLPDIMGILSILALPALAYWGNISGELPIPFHQWRHALPAVFIGLFLRYNASNNKLKIFTIAIILAAFHVDRIGGNAYGIPYALGTLLCSLSIASKNIVPASITQYSGASYGIYLFHPILYTLAYGAGLKPSLFLACTVFGLSFFLIHHLRKLPCAKICC